MNSSPKIYCLILFILCLCSLTAEAQQPYIYGRVIDANGFPLPGASVATNMRGSFGTVTDHNGNYRMDVPAETLLTIRISYIGYYTEESVIWISYGQLREINVVLHAKSQILGPVVVYTKRFNKTVTGIKALQKADVETVPTPSMDGITAILRTMPGVTANNELSSQYAVRGGNFDENLIYVNDFEVYRPFLIRSGQQEGLSFVNADMISDIGFSAGGFEAKYGDKMSSVLDVKYKKPTEFGGSASVSLLGTTAHVEGRSADKRFTYIGGMRQQSNQYILNALPTEGDYRPSFTDAQAFLTWQVGSDWEFQAIGNFARNRYNFFPKSSETSFGTFNDALNLRIYFDGQEKDAYTTGMAGFAAIYNTPKKKVQLKLLTSAYTTNETEAFDIIGQYWVGEVENNLGEDDFGEVTRILGVGTYHDWARNQLKATIANVAHKGAWDLHKKHFLRWGAKYQYETINDKLNEWYRLDSAGYNIPYTGTDIQLSNLLKTEIDLQSNRFQAYVQDEWSIGKNNRLEAIVGTRFNYWDVNDQLLISPRLQLAYTPKLTLDSTKVRAVDNFLTFRMAAGLYQQPAFYREMRNSAGLLNTDLLAQRSAHFIFASEYTFNISERPFKLTAEYYYKHLWDLVPYQVENVLIRYSGKNEAIGYATGLDLRLNGEFVPGTDSWISLSVMQTKENLDNDFFDRYYNSDGEQIISGITSNNTIVDTTRYYVGYVPRPSDQRVNFGMFFQDYLPRNENFKMHLSLLVGTGLSFSPPDLPQFRNKFRVPPYRRVDIGFSASLFDRSKAQLHENSKLRYLNSVWASLEVFNLLGVQNTVSYNWILAQGQSYGVPNYLTARRLNLRIIAKF